MASVVGPFDVVSILLWVVFMGVTMLYGQRIQLFMIMKNIRKNLSQLGRMKDEARSMFVSAVSKFNPNPQDITGRVDTLLEMFAITPVDMDPKGIVYKLEHLLESYEARAKSEVTRLAPKASEVEVSNLTNLMEVSLGLNTMFRVVRHFYLMGRKSNNVFTLAQLQMVLPLIMDEAEAYHSSLESFTQSKPIGDGLGPLVAATLINGVPVEEITRDTVVAEKEFENRHVFIVKAKGPGGNVGRPGEAVRVLLENHKDISLVVTVDAGLKLEGEKSGQVQEGVGVAIGGPGVDRYKIEEASAETRVPAAAVVVRMSSKEAINTMTEEVYNAAPVAMERVRDVVTRMSKEKSKIVITGIGNTIGIGQSPPSDYKTLVGLVTPVVPSK